MRKFSDMVSLKGLAREHMQGNYMTAVMAYIWMSLILILISWLSALMIPQGSGSRVFSLVYLVIYYLISCIFSGGMTYLFLHIVNGIPAKSSLIFYCFRYHTDRVVLIGIYKAMVELLGISPILFVYYLLPEVGEYGEYAALAIVIIVAWLVSIVIESVYLPALYLVHDFPDMGVREIIGRSPELIRGCLGSVLKMYISFIPLKLLELLSLGVGAPWAESYIEAIKAECYMDLMRSGVRAGSRGY